MTELEQLQNQIAQLDSRVQMLEDALTHLIQELSKPDIEICHSLESIQ